MNKNISYDKFVKFLSDRFGETPENIKQLNDFGELGLDSLTLFSLIDELETYFEIKIDVNDLTDIDTVDKMYYFIENNAMK